MSLVFIVKQNLRFHLYKTIYMAKKGKLFLFFCKIDS